VNDLQVNHAAALYNRTGNWLTIWLGLYDYSMHRQSSNFIRLDAEKRCRSASVDFGDSLRRGAISRLYAPLALPYGI